MTDMDTLVRLNRIIELLERSDARDEAAFARMTEVLDAQKARAAAQPTEAERDFEDRGAGFSPDESAMLRFLALCQPSLDPDYYEGVYQACRQLCSNRSGMGDDALARCLARLGKEFDERLAAKGVQPATDARNESRSANEPDRPAATREWPDRCSCVRRLVTPIPMDRFASCDPPGYSIAKGCKYCGGTGAPVRAPWNALPDAVPAPRHEDLPKPPPGTTLDILFDGPPGPEPGRFVEAERDGKSVRAGTWIKGPGELWTLRLAAADLPAAEKSIGDLLAEACGALPSDAFSYYFDDIDKTVNYAWAEVTVSAQAGAAVVTATAKLLPWSPPLPPPSE